jgi:aspartyl-tRNA(Asn)/glutamyl-tRNA(Gln) amidotransferase subunit C
MAPKVSEAEVRQVAALVRLELSDEEVQRLAVELGAVLDNAGRLDELLEREEPPPRDGEEGPGCPLRADEVRKGLVPEAFLGQAPDRHDDHLRVPPTWRGAHDDD